MKKKRIPDKGITEPEHRGGKAQISYRGLEGLGKEKAGKDTLGPDFKEFQKELLDFIRKQWLCFGRFSPLLYEMVVHGEKH